MTDNKTYYLEKFYKIQKAIIILMMSLFIVLIVSSIWQNANPSVNSNLSPLNTSIQANNDSSELFGNIELITENNLSLAYALVLINNEPIADFANGEVLIRVYPEDSITIDGSAYKKELSFELTAISSNIDKSYLKTMITTNGNSVDAGTIVFK